MLDTLAKAEVMVVLVSLIEMTVKMMMTRRMKRTISMEI